MGFFSKLFAQPSDAKPVVSLAGRRILAVEPSITIQKVIELTFADASIAIARNGAEARAAMRAGQFDLVIVAITLPDMTGYDLCSTIKAESRTPVILLYGTFEAFDENRAKLCGADSILTKPFQSKELLAVAGRLLV